MFETTVVESRISHASRSRALTLPVSLGLHAAVAATAILASTWSITVPRNSPPQYKPFIMAALPRIPVEVQPRPQTRPEPARVTPVRVDTPPAGPVVDAPPTRMPDQTPDLTPGQATGPVTGPVQWDWSGTGETGTDSGSGGPPAQTGPYVVGAGGATRPVIIQRVEPVYPPFLVKAKLNGHAVVECVVEEDGRITSAQIVGASHPLFGEAAREAVLQWRFQAGLLNGEPVPTIFRLTVNFHVRR